MKTKLLLVLSFVNMSLFAQVGINTDKPRETVHVNGTLRVGDLPLNKKDSIYNVPDSHYPNPLIIKLRKQNSLMLFIPW